MSSSESPAFVKPPSQDGIEVDVQVNWVCQLHTGTCRGHLPPTSTRIQPSAAAATELQQPLEGAQAGRQTADLCALGKAGGTGPQRDISRSWFYEPNS